MTPADLHSQLTGDREVALVDVREEGEFGAEHLLLAVNVPLGRIETEFARLVPRKAVRIVLCDDGGGEAVRAEALLKDAGYSDVSRLDGGVAAWKQAGFMVFSGVNVPSKAFGELVEHAEGTPHIEARALMERLRAGEKVVIVDSRPMDEYRVMNIPGSTNMPGAELVYRIKTLAPDPQTTVVVNCAGRTRSIIGAQSLRNAGLENPVLALKNGTMGWHLSGLELEQGAERIAPAPGAAQLAWAQEAAAGVARRFGVEEVDAETVARWRGPEAGRTCFLLDTRSPEDYEAGHVPGALSAPGGQLVQATDSYVGVRNARLVLLDDDAVRAPMTASWLKQMGWGETYTARMSAFGARRESGAAPAEPLIAPPSVKTVEPAELARQLEAGDVVVVDIADSLTFGAKHIPGAYWAVRSRFEQEAGALPESRRYVVTSGDGLLARFAAPELARCLQSEVHALAGGTQAWESEGRAMQAGAERLVSTPNDVFYRPYDRRHGVEEAMKDYLRWEVDLVNRLDADGTLRFPTFGR
ncbi:rhodanese-like domain-containing protein [Pelagibius sp. CAU 1746]|uniref:rhodanese-like domain-containing protein n=1 Tax=Pelagibius sp. CAU 1746 TaxID=3140370 RepID=UPI00325BE167